MQGCDRVLLLILYQDQGPKLGRYKAEQAAYDYIGFLWNQMVKKLLALERVGFELV
jgi:hypothetical protein